MQIVLLNNVLFVLFPLFVARGRYNTPIPTVKTRFMKEKR